MSAVIHRTDPHLRIAIESLRQVADIHARRERMLRIVCIWIAGVLLLAAVFR